jgi:glycosyltransferase involved in cell wall biosynthesis
MSLSMPRDSRWPRHEISFATAREVLSSAVICFAMPKPVTAYTLTFNEAGQIRAVLESVKWADEIIIVDSFSTDGTVEIAREFGAKIISENFCGFGKLRNFALAAAKHDWMFSIDADERCTPEFVDELRETLVEPKHAAYFVPRRNTFLGKPVRFGGMYPDYRQPQVFDRRKFRYREDPVHESFHCDGSIGHFKNFIWQHPWPTLKVIMQKGDRYTTLVARQRFEKGRRAGVAQLLGHPPAAFFKKYLLQQGFRDGVPGLMIAMLHAFFTFVKFAKLWELQQSRTPS